MSGLGISICDLDKELRGSESDVRGEAWKLLPSSIPLETGEQAGLTGDGELEKKPSDSL